MVHTYKVNVTHRKSSLKGKEFPLLVEKRIAWPHDIILGGNTKQRVTYNQLSLPQFVQGFVKNILD